jgi:hypothetical protein
LVSDFHEASFGARRHLMAWSGEVDPQLLDDFRRPATEHPDSIRKIDGFFDVRGKEMSGRAEFFPSS